MAEPSDDMLARLMALWACQSRKDLREALYEGGEQWAHAGWVDTGIPPLLSVESKQHLEDLYRNADTEFSQIAIKNNKDVDEWWRGQMGCPPANYINTALTAMVVKAHAAGANLGD